MLQFLNKKIVTEERVECWILIEFASTARDGKSWQMAELAGWCTGTRRGMSKHVSLRSTLLPLSQTLILRGGQKVTASSPQALRRLFNLHPSWPPFCQHDKVEQGTNTYPNYFNSAPSLIKNSAGLMKTSLLVLWGLWDPGGSRGEIVFHPWMDTRLVCSNFLDRPPPKQYNKVVQNSPTTSTSILFYVTILIPSPLFRLLKNLPSNPPPSSKNSSSREKNNWIATDVHHNAGEKWNMEYMRKRICICQPLHE